MTFSAARQVIISAADLVVFSSAISTLRMSKCQPPSPHTDRPTDISVFFKNDYFEQIIKLNFFSDPEIVSASGGHDWYTYLKDSTNEFCEMLEKAMVKYGLYLTEDTDIMEGLINSHFVYLVNDYIEGVRHFTIGLLPLAFFDTQIEKTAQDKKGEKVIDFVRIYVHLFSKLLEKYNQQFPDEPICIEEDLWDDTKCPHIGSGIMKIKEIG